VADGVSQNASHALKQKFIASFNMPHTIPCGMDKLQAHTNFTFLPFDLQDDGYLGCDSSLSSSKEPLCSYAEAKSSDIVITPVMVIEAANLEE